MAVTPGKSKTVSFARVFPVLLIVAILFQLLFAKDLITDFKSALDIIIKTIGTSLLVSLTASGTLILFTRKQDN